MYRKCAAVLGLVVLGFSVNGADAFAADCDDLIARHMVGEAMLAAQFVASAEKAGMAPAQINAALKSISESSAIEEFWITDSAGHAYLTRT
jgi:predicted trehalose synthase